MTPPKPSVLINQCPTNLEVRGWKLEVGENLKSNPEILHFVQNDKKEAKDDTPKTFGLDKSMPYESGGWKLEVGENLKTHNPKPEILRIWRLEVGGWKLEKTLSQTRRFFAALRMTKKRLRMPPQTFGLDKSRPYKFKGKSEF